MAQFKLIAMTSPVTVRIKGGCSGHWELDGTRVELGAHSCATRQRRRHAELLALDAQGDRRNSAVDVADFNGGIAGCHEVLASRLARGHCCSTAAGPQPGRPVNSTVSHRYRT